MEIQEMSSAVNVQKRTLVLECLPLVQRVARNLATRLPAQVELDDLTQAGVLGLLDAAEKFDRAKGARFWTYAELRIRGAILDSLRGLDWVPRSVRRRARELDAASARIQTRESRPATEAELARELELSVEELRKIQVQIHRAMTSFRVTEGVESVVPGPGERSLPTPHEILERREIKALLVTVLETLSERERLVISLYYHEELTMKEVGEVLGVNESRISQIHGKAVERLRARLRQELAPRAG